MQDEGERCKDSVRHFGRESMQVLFDWISAQDGPWFAWVAPNLQHHPHDAASDLRQIYVDLGTSDEAETYYANLSRTDRRVGEVIRHLADNGVTQDMVVIHLADDGWQRRDYAGVPPGELDARRCPVGSASSLGASASQ